MCLILLALGVHPRFPVIVAANRDEFHARPTARAQSWDDAPEVFGGRDLEKGGSWLALSGRGALAAVTNYRDPSRRRAAAPSRGALVSDFVRRPLSASEYITTTLANGDAYDGFNLLVADATGIWYGSNRGASPQRLGTGVHGLSNHLIGTPWPKVLRATRAMERALSSDVERLEPELLAVLRDDARAADDELPATGVSLEWERVLSPIFIRADDYGTRASTIVTIDASGRASFLERTFGPTGTVEGDVRRECRLAAPIAI